MQDLAALQNLSALPNVGRSSGRGFSAQHLDLARQGTLKVPETHKVVTKGPVLDSLTNFQVIHHQYNIISMQTKFLIKNPSLLDVHCAICISGWHIEFEMYGASSTVINWGITKTAIS